MPYIESIDTQNALLGLILFVILDHVPFLQGLAREQSVQEVFFSLVSSGFASLALFLCMITRDRFQAIAYAIADCYSLRHASHLLLLCDKLAGKVPLVLVTVSASHASVLLKRQFKLLLHRLVYEDFLTHLKPVALQVPHDRSRFDDSGILAECIIASKHVTQLLALLVLRPGLVSRDHEYVFGWVRLDLALDFLG